MRIQEVARRVAYSRLSFKLRDHWPLYQAVSDAGLYLSAVVVATVFRNDLQPDRVQWSATVWFAVLGALALVGVGRLCGLYSRRWRYGSFEEVAGVFGAALGGGVVMIAIESLADSRPVPLGAALTSPLVALLGMLSIRYVGRMILAAGHPAAHPDAARVVVYGAGSAGTQLVRSLLGKPGSRYVPVGLLDDNPTRRNLRVSGVRVLGGRADIGRVVASVSADLVVIAIPSASGEELRELAEAVGAAGVQVRTLPSVTELVDGTVTGADIRELTEADLLGRRTIDTDIDSIAAYVKDRRVLVTGAGGSIGSELCRQLHRFGPDRLVMLDRDESALHAVQLSLDGRAQLDSRNVVVADIRDPDRILEVFEEHRPEVVFHAAALKHVPLLELYPVEAAKTNVLGTANVLAAAVKYGVGTFVNVSTDKAASPENVLGYTKRITERLTAAAARHTGSAFTSVRFGNVIGSRGSVLPAFQRMIEAGGPVTVTDPEVTRYFMTIPEAVQLIIQAGAMGRPESVMILDMGSPVRIADVARRLIEASGRQVALEFTGLRPGEKLHEVLFDDHEIAVQSAHPLIRMTSVEPCEVDGDLLVRLRDREIVEHLRWIARSTEQAAQSLQAAG